MSDLAISAGDNQSQSEPRNITPGTLAIANNNKELFFCWGNELSLKLLLVFSTAVEREGEIEFMLF